jgi:hypothetical protein
MRPENFEARKQLLTRFILFYAGSIALLLLAFFGLSSREGTTQAAHAGKIAGVDKKVTNRLTAELDSTRQQVWKLRRQLFVKDSLIDLLAIAPVPDIPDGAFEKKELARIQKEQAGVRDALQKIRYDSTALQQQLDDQLRAGSALTDQVTNLRHKNETLRSRLYPDFTTGTGGIDVANGPDPAWTRAVERQSAQLNNDLRLAEVDCNLSRADARQIVYTAKQRKELLTEALRTLNDLANSTDEDVQRKARERLATLRNIASTMHD